MALILASSSKIRQKLLKSAGVMVEIIAPMVDEQSIKQALLEEKAKPKDIADALAEAKALKVSSKNLDKYVLGTDQILEIEGDILSKPTSLDEAEKQLRHLQGKLHRLISAAVIYYNGQPVWRHIETVSLKMRPLSDSFIASYIARNGADLCNHVGVYKLEEEGIRLFQDIQGDYFSALGLPLLPILNYLEDVKALS